MKPFLIALVCSLACICTVQAQSPALVFDYDAAGNRIKRYDPPGKTEVLPIGLVNSSISTKLFPNPTNSFVTIQASAEITDGVLLLNDLSGRTLTQQTFSGTQTTLNLSTLPAGVYFVRLNAKDYEQLWKVVKN